MAYQATGNTQSITSSTLPVTGYPFTLHAVAKTTSDITYMSAIYLRNADSTNYVHLFLSGAATGDPVIFEAVDSGSAAASSTSAFSLTAWNYCAGVGTSATSRTVYLNAGNSATNTTSKNPSAWSVFRVLTPNNGVTGQVAEAAVWNVDLTSGEIVSLAKGFKPSRIRPQSLVFYAPLIRNLQDFKAAITLTNNNSCTVSNHPRVY